MVTVYSARCSIPLSPLPGTSFPASTIQYYFIAKCQYNCTRNVLRCQVHSSHIHSSLKTSLSQQQQLRQPGVKQVQQTSRRVDLPVYYLTKTSRKRKPLVANPQFIWLCWCISQHRNRGVACGCLRSVDRDRLPAGVAHKPDYPGHQKAGRAGPGGWERCVWVVGGVLKRQGYNSSFCAIHLWLLPASYIFCLCFLVCLILLMHTCFT